MNDLDREFADMTGTVLNAFGRSVFYQPVTGVGDTIDVVRTDNVEVVGEFGHVQHKGTVFDIAREDVDEPHNGDTIEEGDCVWTVQEIVEWDQHMSRVAVRG